MSNSNQNMTLRERVTQKLSQSEDGIQIGFEPLEARLAGYFLEDAISEDDVEASNEEENV